MKIRNRITKLITLTLAVAVLLVIGTIWTTERASAVGATAQTGWAQKSVIATIPGTTLASGQMLRFNVVNPNTPETGSEPVTAQVRIYDMQGNVLARSEELEVPPGQLRNFDFKRDELPAAGEPGTGRLLVRAGISYEFTDRPEQISPNYFPLSIELFNTAYGRHEGAFMGNLFSATPVAK